MRAIFLAAAIVVGLALIGGVTLLAVSPGAEAELREWLKEEACKTTAAYKAGLARC